jgi:hypothetical protein
MVYMDPALKKDLINELYLKSRDSAAKHELWNENVRKLKPTLKPQSSERFHLLLSLLHKYLWQLKKRK